MKRGAGSVALALALVIAIAAAPGLSRAQAGGKPPSTFGPVIGSALLCRDQLDNRYFYSYMTAFFGAPYKHEGGAFWFRTPDTTLWGAPVSEVMVSDDTSEKVFLAAVAEVPPDQLEQSVRTVSGIHYLAADATAYPLRVSNLGGTIAYYNTKSKIYCAKFKPLPPRP